MEQILLLDETIRTLKEEAYTVLSMGLYDPQYWTSSSFDLAARKDILLMIKIALNIDKISTELIDDLKLIAFFFNGVPIVLGKETRSDPLREDVVYERQGIPAMSLLTFKRLLRKDQIHIVSRKGGFFVKVDKDKIHELRVKKSLSLQEVATELGVSRKAVYLFEHADHIKEQNALQLEKLFQDSVTLPIDIFNWEIEPEKSPPSIEPTDFQAEIKEIFQDLGYDTYWAKKAPFDAIAAEMDPSKTNAEGRALITGLSLSHKMRIYNRLQIISEISKVARRLSMFIIDEGKLPPIENVLILQKAILEKMKDIRDLYQKLKKVKRTFY